MRSWVVVCILLAGCASQTATEHGPQSEPTFHVPDGNSTVEVNVTVEPAPFDARMDSFRMEVAADEDGHAAGFVIPIPDGAETSNGYQCGKETLKMRFTPGVSDVDQWGLTLVDLDSGAWIRTIGSTGGSKLETAFGEVAPTSEPVTVTAKTGPVTIQLLNYMVDNEAPMRDGDRLGVILFASASAPTNFTVDLAFLEDGWAQERCDDPGRPLNGTIHGLQSHGESGAARWERHWLHTDLNTAPRHFWSSGTSATIEDGPGSPVVQGFAFEWSAETIGWGAMHFRGSSIPAADWSIEAHVDELTYSRSGPWLAAVGPAATFTWLDENATTMSLATAGDWSSIRLMAPAIQAEVFSLGATLEALLGISEVYVAETYWSHEIGPASCRVFDCMPEPW